MDPEHAPLTYPVVIWLDIAQLLAAAGDDGLVATIHAAVDCRRLAERVPLALTADEQAWIRTARMSIPRLSGGTMPA